MIKAIGYIQSACNDNRESNLLVNEFYDKYISTIFESKHCDFIFKVIDDKKLAFELYFTPLFDSYC